MPSLRVRVAVLVGVAVLTSGWGDAQQRPRAVPVDPVLGIVDAFRSHQVVAFSDSHGNSELLAFELRIVQDSRIRALINDIVIENGNTRYQDAMDRYVRGDDVPYDTLRRVWHETTQTQTLGPRDGVIPELYQIVRRLNQGLPRQRQLRVLLGDPPIDWSVVKTQADHRRWIEQRDSHAAEVIRREVVSRDRRSLVVYGQGHLQRKNLLANYSSEGLAGTVVSILEASARTKVFSIWWLRGPKAPPVETAAWPAPSLALVRGTTLGALDFTDVEAAPPSRATIRDGKIVPVAREEWLTLRLEDQFDAVLKLADASPATAGRIPLTREQCQDFWTAEWRRRLAIGNGPQEQAMLRQIDGDCGAR
jgi:hypothetical protein